MNTLLIVIFTLLGLLILWQWCAGQKAMGMQGQSAPDTSAVDQGIQARRKVYFFHAVHCKPCKSMMPLIDELRRDFPNLIKLDVSENIQLARSFKLAGTPSFFAVNDGVIESVKLGPTDEQWLRAHLE